MVTFYRNIHKDLSGDIVNTLCKIWWGFIKSKVCKKLLSLDFTSLKLSHSKNYAKNQSQKNKTKTLHCKSLVAAD